MFKCTVDANDFEKRFLLLKYVPSLLTGVKVMVATDEYNREIITFKHGGKWICKRIDTRDPTYGDVLRGSKHSRVATCNFSKEMCSSGILGSMHCYEAWIIGTPGTIMKLIDSESRVNYAIFSDNNVSIVDKNPLFTMKAKEIVP